MGEADATEPIVVTRAGWGGPPLVVLMSGAPGSGKTTLAGRLGDIMRLPVVSKDRLRQGTMWTLGTDDIDEAPVGPPLFYDILGAYVRLGISVIGDMTLFPGLSEPDIGELLAPRARLVNVHCRTPHAVERFARRSEIDPIHRHHLDRLLPTAAALQETTFEPLDLPCRTVVVDTSDGYQPTLPTIVEAITSTSSVGHC